MHCVVTLFGKLNLVDGGSRNVSLRQHPHRTSAQSPHGRSLAIKGGTQLHCVVTLFGKPCISFRRSKIKGCTQLHCGAILIGGWHTGRDDPHCSIATAQLTGINHIDDMTVDDSLMVDGPCLKSQTLTVRMSLRAGDNSISPHGWDSRPPTEGSSSLHPRSSERGEVGSDASHHSFPAMSTRGKTTVAHEPRHGERCEILEVVVLFGPNTQCTRHKGRSCPQAIWMIT